MAAAALTPTIIMEEVVPMKGKTGTPIRLVKYFFKVTKITAADWIVTATHFPGTYLTAVVTTIDGSGDGADDTLTYVSSGTKLVMSSSDVGTAYGWVTCQVA